MAARFVKEMLAFEPEALIAPHTVNTAPPKTIEAFLDHGTVEQTISSDYSEAHQVFDDLKADPERVHRDLLHFLGLSPVPLPKLSPRRESTESSHPP